MTKNQASEIAFDFEFQESSARTYLEFDWSRDFGELSLELIVPRGSFGRDNTAVFTLMIVHRRGDEISILKTDKADVLCGVLEGLVPALEKADLADATR